MTASLSFRPRLPRHPLTPPPAAGDAPSRFAFSLPKAGSTLLFNMLREVAPQAGLTYFSAEDALFAANVDPNGRPGDIGPVFHPTGYCYGGFRAFPAYPVPRPAGGRSLFLVRDPRDMAVSLYFSLLKSHVLPRSDRGDTGARGALLKERQRLEQVGIDRFVVNNASARYRRLMEAYVGAGFLSREDVAVFRYEDVIFRKEEWLHDICQLFGWAVAADHLRGVAERFDERPAEARPDRHVRVVTPGDHRNHLTARSIHLLDEAFAEYDRWFGYR